MSRTDAFDSLGARFTDHDVICSYVSLRTSKRRAGLCGVRSATLLARVRSLPGL